jgi:hypothetical protein
MNRRKKEKQVEALGPPWSKTMEVYKQATGQATLGRERE